MFKKTAVTLLVSMLMLAGCKSPEEKAQDFYQKGQAFYQEGDLGKAEVEYKNAIQIDKKMADAYYGLALVYEKRQEIKKAASFIRKALDSNPNHLEANIKMGRIHVLTGKFDEALKLSINTLNVSPQNYDALILRSLVLLKLGDAEESIKYARQAMEIDNNKGDAYNILASERMLAEDFEQAKAFIQQGLAADAKDVTLNLLQLSIARQLNDKPTIISTFKRLISHYPEAPTYRVEYAAFLAGDNQLDAADQVYAELMEGNSNKPEYINLYVNYLTRTQRAEQAKIFLREKIAANGPEKIRLSFILAKLLNDLGDDQAYYELITELSQSNDEAEQTVKAKSLLIAYYQKKKQFDKAEAITSEVLAQDPRSEIALYARAEKAIENKQYDAAVSDMRTVLRDSPTAFHALFLLGRAFELSNSPDLAEDYYQKAYQASGKSLQYGKNYVRYLMQRGHTDVSDKVLQELIDRNRREVSLYVDLVKIKLSQKDWSAADNILSILDELGAEPALRLQIKGAIQTGRKDYAKSIESFRSAYEMAPDSMQPVVSLLRIYLATKQNEQALSFINSVIEVNPNNKDARYLKAQVLLAIGQKDQAISYYQTLLEQNPADSKARYRLAWVLAEQGDNDAALSQLDQGLQQDAENTELNLLKARIQQNTGDMAGAIATYNVLHKVLPDSPVVANNLASLMLDYATDQASFQQANTIALELARHDSPYFKDTLGWSYYRLGDTMQALKYISEAASRLQENPDVLYHMGKVYMELDRKEDAKREFEKALEFSKNSPAFLYTEEINRILAEI